VRRILELAGTLALAIGLNLTASPVDAASSGKIVVTGATVTAAPANGESAVVLSIANDSKGPISLTSVSSPVSGMAMMYYDQNMRQGDHAMRWLENILIQPGHVQRLALRFQGAMLSDLHTALLKGSTVPLVVKWSNFQSARSLTIDAKVVAAPKGLRFHMSTMNMKM
jgi:copper(I)-binding protein